MSPDSSSNPPRGASWFLRRTDQAVVAFLAACALVATVGWWIAQGGPRERLVDLDDAESSASTDHSARFWVDVNRADLPELSQMPGIGPTLAERIVVSREADGPFRVPEDLLRIRGIGQKKLDALRPYLRPMVGKEEPAGEPVPPDSP